MVNTYTSDVFFNMDHGWAKPDLDTPNRKAYKNINDNAEMLISMLTELGVDAVNIPTVEELKNDFFDRI